MAIHKKYVLVYCLGGCLLRQTEQSELCSVFCFVKNFARLLPCTQQTGIAVRRDFPRGMPSVTAGTAVSSVKFFPEPTEASSTGRFRWARYFAGQEPNKPSFFIPPYCREFSFCFYPIRPTSILVTKRT